jgi:hypothetical protein
VRLFLCTRFSLLLHLTFSLLYGLVSVTFGLTTCTFEFSSSKLVRTVSVLIELVEDCFFVNDSFSLDVSLEKDTVYLTLSSGFEFMLSSN